MKFMKHQIEAQLVEAQKEEQHLYMHEGQRKTSHEYDFFFNKNSKPIEIRYNKLT